VKRSRQSGAAVLVAMLVVAMVATISAASLWKQWRSVEVESAERSRVQSSWILTGALDWARLILREDARAGGTDHLDEPWAVPLQEARLAAFLAADQPVAGDGQADGDNAFLSGSIADLQSRLNVANLAAVGKVSEPALRSFSRLFETLGLPQSELSLMAESLRLASDISPDNAQGGLAPPMPQRLEHLAAMGLLTQTIAALEPYVTVLPGRTPVNLNTASAQVLYSAIDGISMAEAQRMVDGRAGGAYRSVADAAKQLDGGRELAGSDFSVASRYFEVRGRLRLGQMVVEERSLVQRDGLDVAVLQRGRGTVAF
jgi:general secretion pathway protein K